MYRRRVAVAASFLLMAGLAACAHDPSPRRSATPTPTTTAASASPTVTSPSTPAPTTRPATTVRMPADRPSPSRPVTPTSAAAAGLPLDLATGSATQVVTVTASSYSTTTAVLQTWSRSGAGWVAHSGPVTAHLGSDGLSTAPSETKSATPVGSFTLTQAFGHDGNPGTALPYVQTTPSDWWISQAGSLYNTRQRCLGTCPFSQGDPNEHLYYETPFYNYAVVIDYNTPNAPGGVRQGAGSAFFLHVTNGTPTAGCVSIPQSELVSILRWLTPSAHPRILIGVA